ncbi:MAG: phage holin family protein [Rhodospirillales bacterium]|nr:phage holin family protein [Rhodospirillales bacterium]
MHESLKDKDEVQVGSEKSFGVVFAIVFAAVAFWPLVHGLPIRWWALIVAAFFLVAAYVAQPLLKPLNLLWFKFGLLLYKVVNPVVMGLLYYTTIVPTGLIMRMCGKDPLNRSFDRNAKTYWIERDPPGPEPESMKNQF